MDLTDAFIILRNYTNAGTREREALEYMDDYIYKLDGKRDEARAEVAAWRAAIREFIDADDDSMYGVPPDSEWHAYALATQTRLQAARDRLRALLDEGRGVMSKDPFIQLCFDRTLRRLDTGTGKLFADDPALQDVGHIRAHVKRLEAEVERLRAAYEAALKEGKE